MPFIINFQSAFFFLNQYANAPMPPPTTSTVMTLPRIAAPLPLFFISSLSFVYFAFVSFLYYFNYYLATYFKLFFVLF